LELVFGILNILMLNYSVSAVLGLQMLLLQCICWNQAR